MTRCACFQGPEVWFQWCCWQMEGSPAADAGDAAAVWYARVRSAFEDALAACGLHVTLGSNLWTAYREFETQLLHALEVLLSCVSFFASCLVSHFSRACHTLHALVSALVLVLVLLYGSLLCFCSSHKLFLFTIVQYGDCLFSSRSPAARSATSCRRRSTNRANASPRSSSANSDSHCTVLTNY